MPVSSLSPSEFSGETAGAIARAADPAAPQPQEVQLVASGDKVTGGRKRKSIRKARKSSRKARKANRKSRRRA